MSKMHMVPAHWLDWVSNKDGQLAVNHCASHEADQYVNFWMWKQMIYSVIWEERSQSKTGICVFTHRVLCSFSL